MLFRSGFVKGPVSILEYYEPAYVQQPGLLAISSVVHGYRNLFDRNTMNGSLGKSQGFGDAASCNNNVYCDEGLNWIDQIRSVGMIIVDDNRIGSGALVNNVRQDHTPYFLTANHVGSGDPSTWLVMFGYEALGCSDPASAPPTNLAVTSVLVAASNGDTDFKLLKLSTTPPPYYNVYYSGWSKNNSTGSSAVGIHYPMGDIKKISYDDDAGVSDDYEPAKTGIADSYWRVTWDDGVTQSVSSG